MLTAYRLQEGHGWRKKDIVKALFEFSENWVADEEKEAEEEQQRNPTNEMDQGISSHLHLIILAHMTLVNNIQYFMMILTINKN